MARKKKGVLEGDTARNVRQQLRDQRLSPLNVVETNSKAAKPTAVASFRGGGISTADMSLVMRQLSTLSGSGTPLEEALAAVSRQTEKGRVKALLLSVRTKVLEGHSLADSLREYPNTFPEIYRATVAAGERSGHLDAVLERLADYSEERQATKSAITKALVYPVFLLIMCVLILWGLLAFVVPDVVAIFEDLDQTLPPLTLIVLATSDIIREWGLMLFIALVSFVVLFKRAMKRRGL